MLPKNLYVSGNPWDRAHSRTLTTLCCSGCSTRPWNMDKSIRAEQEYGNSSWNFLGSETDHKLDLIKEIVSLPSCICLTCRNICINVHLLSHRFWICNGCAVESFPFKSTVKAGPMVVSISCVWETPGDKGAILFVDRITLLPFHASAYSPLCPRWGSALFLVMMSVSPALNKFSKYIPFVQINMKPLCKKGQGSCTYFHLLDDVCDNFRTDLTELQLCKNYDGYVGRNWLNEAANVLATGSIEWCNMQGVK